MINRDPVLALIGKELRSWFNSPLLYGIAFFFTLFISVWLYYFQAFFAMNSADLRPFFSGFPYAFVFVIPAITMKSWTEEKKTGTAEMLFTMPVSEWELCLGKFFSSFIILLFLVLLFVPVPLSLMPLGKFDTGVIVTQYAGVLLLGACAVSLGLLCSGLSRNQAAAFLSCAVILLALMFINRFTLTVNLSPAIVQFLNFLSLTFRYENFSRGLFDSRDLVFFAAATVLFLFLNTRLLILRKWN